MNEDWTIVLSGPLTARGPLMGALERAGADFSEGQPLDASHGLPTDPEMGWITTRAPDVDKIVETAGRASWSIRMHWHTPSCLACAGETCLHCKTGKTNKVPPPRDLLKELDELKARLNALGG